MDTELVSAGISAGASILAAIIGRAPANKPVENNMQLAVARPKKRPMRAAIFLGILAALLLSHRVLSSSPESTYESDHRVSSSSPDSWHDATPVIAKQPTHRPHR